jgi:hypothetical protein
LDFDNDGMGQPAAESGKNGRGKNNLKDNKGKYPKRERMTMNYYRELYQTELFVGKKRVRDSQSGAKKVS